MLPVTHMGCALRAVTGAESTTQGWTPGASARDRPLNNAPSCTASTPSAGSCASFADQFFQEAAWLVFDRSRIHSVMLEPDGAINENHGLTLRE